MLKRDNKIINRAKDGMLLGTIYDQIMLKVKYNVPRMHFLYGVMVGQKHRMLYYKKFRKKYYSKCILERPWEMRAKENKTDVVWSLWLQGIDNAPDIVKKCVDSQKKYMPDKKIIVLDESTIHNYVTLPDYIEKKWKEGIIGNAQYSDLVRNELLIKYGGYWIDSTVLFTDNKIISYIDSVPFFMFSFYYFGFNPEIMQLNNWFIHSTTNNNIICLLQKMLLEYWKDHDRCVNYFIYQIFESIANEFYFEEFRQMPVLSQAQAHLLASYIYDDFDEFKYDFLKETTGVHKLSYRFDQKRLKREGNFYDVVINKGNY